MPLKLRTTLYILVILFALGETALGWWVGFTNGWSPHLRIFGRFAGIVSLFAWIWVGVLLSYHNKPGSTHPLTRTFVHMHTFTVLAGLYLALGIAIASQAATECGEGYSDGLSRMWCGVSASASGVAFWLGILSCITALIIYLYSPKMKANVCSGDIVARPVVQSNELVTIA